MSRPLYVFPLLAALFVWCDSAWPAPMTRPQVEYSADSTIQTEDMTLQERIYYTPTKERREMIGGPAAGHGMAMIFRHDEKVLWQLMPTQKMYMEHRMGQAQAGQKRPDVSQWDFEETVVGEETIDGMKVTKYKTIATSTDGKKFGGFSWRTKEGIPIKMDLLFKEGNEKHRMTTELKNVKIGKQDPELFEVPKDFTKFDMGGMMGGMGRPGMGGPGMGRPDMGQPGMGRPDMSGQGRGRPDMPAPSEESASTEPTDEKTQRQKANEMMKKFFGR
jgi:hypothetical protein